MYLKRIKEKVRKPGAAVMISVHFFSDFHVLLGSSVTLVNGVVVSSESMIIS